MNRLSLTSTFFLTSLLGIGLFFFIRASTKDRTESIQLVAEQSEVSLLEQLQAYFVHRAYRVADVKPELQQVTFAGMVRPSLPLAIFLSFLAGVGLLCLGLVLAIVWPNWAAAFLGLVILAPLAGVFYWQGAGRVEQVTLRVEPAEEADHSNLVTVIAHRDELAELQKALQGLMVTHSRG